MTPEDEDCDGSSPACGEPWSISFAANSDFTPSFVETDAAGNVYLGGTFTGSLDLGGGALTGVGTADIFVAKFDADGNHVWSKRFGEAIDDVFLTGMDVNADGDIALSGIFYDSLDFGGDPITADPSGPFAAVLDTNGDHVWSATAEGNVTWATPIAFDGQGNVSYGVFYGGSIYFGGAEVHMGSGIAIAKYDAATGAFVSSAGFAGCAPASYSTGLDATANGDVIFVGKAPFSGSCDWGGGPVPAGSGIAMAGLAMDYASVFSDVFASVAVEAPFYAAYGPNGEIALTTMGSGPVDFAGTVVNSSTSSVTGLLAVLEPTAEFRYGKYFDAPSGVGTRLGRPQFSSSLGQVAVHGTLVSPTSIGAFDLSPIGVEDSLLIHLSPTGAVLTATQYGGAMTATEGSTMAVHPTGTFVVAGRYAGSSGAAQGPDFGQGNLPGGTEMRGFLASVAPR